MTTTILLVVLSTAAADADAATSDLVKMVTTAKSLDITVCTDTKHPQRKTRVTTRDLADLELLAKAMQ